MKFKSAQLSGNCQTGPYISDAAEQIGKSASGFHTTGAKYERISDDNDTEKPSGFDGERSRSRSPWELISIR